MCWMRVLLIVLLRKWSLLQSFRHLSGCITKLSSDTYARLLWVCNHEHVLLYAGDQCVV